MTIAKKAAESVVKRLLTTGKTPSQSPRSSGTGYGRAPESNLKEMLVTNEPSEIRKWAGSASSEDSPGWLLPSSRSDYLRRQSLYRSAASVGRMKQQFADYERRKDETDRAAAELKRVLSGRVVPTFKTYARATAAGDNPNTKQSGITKPGDIYDENNVINRRTIWNVLKYSFGMQIPLVTPGLPLNLGDLRTVGEPKPETYENPRGWENLPGNVLRRLVPAIEDPKLRPAPPKPEQEENCLIVGPLRICKEGKVTIRT